MAVHYLAVYSNLGSLITQSLTPTATGTMAVEACVIILCSFLCRCLQKVTKQQRETATFCILENVNYTRTNFRISFSKFDAILHSVWDISAV